jgi:hypothetical protein
MYRAREESRQHAHAHRVVLVVVAQRADLKLCTETRAFFLFLFLPHPALALTTLMGWPICSAFTNATIGTAGRKRERMRERERERERKREREREEEGESPEESLLQLGRSDQTERMAQLNHAAAIKISSLNYNLMSSLLAPLSL